MDYMYKEDGPAQNPNERTSDTNRGRGSGFNNTQDEDFLLKLGNSMK